MTVPYARYPRVLGYIITVAKSTAARVVVVKVDVICVGDSTMTALEA